MKLSSTRRDIAQGDGIVAIQSDVESKIPTANQGMYILYMYVHVEATYLNCLFTYIHICTYVHMCAYVFEQLQGDKYYKTNT